MTRPGPPTATASYRAALSLALLLAGAHPEPVQGAVLCDGPGLAGGGSRPLTPILPSVDPRADGPPDPFALAELAERRRVPLRALMDQMGIEPTIDD